MAFLIIAPAGKHLVAVEYCPDSFAERLARADALVVARIFFGNKARIEGRGLGMQELPAGATAGDAAGMSSVWYWPADTTNTKKKHSNQESANAEA